MHTGRWWWSTQIKVEEQTPGATIVPIIISSDKTQLTLFRNKSAYPEIRKKPSRQAQILLAYLPTTRLEQITNAASRRRTLANLFHACMRLGKVGLDMACGNGDIHRCHPIFATFVGDYPEQVLVTCTKYGDCPVCPIGRHDLGSGTAQPARNLEQILNALGKADEHPTVFAQACIDAGIKPVYRPFWEGLPYVNIYRSITPDVLHQLYQGLIKHLVAWLTSAFGATEIDARCRRMPPNHNTRLFFKGISTLSRVSGQEHRDISRILLGLIVDLRLPGDNSPAQAAQLVRCVRGLLDFLYLAQYKVHSTETLDELDAARQLFHDNKTVLVELGIRTHFNFPKLHFADHYRTLIELFGTTDNYNTQTTERLHIDFVKDAYEATNHKDEFIHMTIWLERKEKILLHERFVRWRLSGSLPALPRPPDIIHVKSNVQVTKRPSTKLLSFDDIADNYVCCIGTRPSLSESNPRHSIRLHNVAANVRLGFGSLALFHKLRFAIPSPQPWIDANDIQDVAHCRPGYTDRQGREISARFDTVLVNLGQGENVGVKGYRVAQIRAVFLLSNDACERLFPTGVDPFGPLAYVEWFSKFPSTPHRDHKMFKVSRSFTSAGYRYASVIPIANIRRTVKLFPIFGPVAPREWTSGDVLEVCNNFYVDPFLDEHTYFTLR
ncbi:hypothetical protein BXZ70DRAFT_938839 [Cristinia sonorae]|uniref:Uncharacterized protein n=2 Tax=Cristinia sonorae TaxID=1940300 RepID=A0A8K0UN29_9AGAR|nr:hypothetical protein BXZ70DRAFT_938839 [Cristinia sonorae]